MPKQTSAELLQKALLRQKKSRPGYSLRRLSQQMAVSPAFLSNVFRGKKPLPLKHLSKLAKCLDIDDVNISRIKDTLMLENLPPALRAMAVKGKKRRLIKLSLSPFERHQDLPGKEYSVLHHWYNLSILDLVTCEGFSPEPAWIARRLGITETQARQAWAHLEQLGHVKKENGRWVKVAENIRFPTSRSEGVVRNYHAQSLGLARAELEKTSDEDFANRLIMGMSLAVNKEKVPEAKILIQAALHEICAKLTTQPCTEVYQLQVQLFPVTKGEI